MWIPSMSLTVRTAPVTATNKSTAITITTWSLMITFILMFLTRETIKFSVLRKFDGDDIAILIATILGIGFSATTLVLASEGLGVLERLTWTGAEIFMKAYYASNFLYISSLCFAKLSLVAYFYNVLIGNTRRVVIGLGIFVVVWTIASLGAVAFQCKLPKPWDMMRLGCLDTGLFWIVYCIIDMTTDFVIVMLSVNLVLYLKVSLSHKVIVVACFAPRILVMAAALTRLLYLYSITPHDDPHFNLWIPVICAQVEVCLAISTACGPYIKPLFEGVEGGVKRAHEIRKRGRSTASKHRLGANLAGVSAMKKGKMLYSMGSTVSVGPLHGQESHVSPRIPTPAPLSPLSPPQYATPAGSISSSKATLNGYSSSRASSEQGLKIHVPASPRRTGIVHDADFVSPETANSPALSPRLPLPPAPQQPIVPARNSLVKEPTSLTRSHVPHPSVSSSYYGDSPALDLSLRSSPPSPNYSLFPTPVPHARYAFKPPNRQPLIQKHRSDSQRNVPEPAYPPRVSSRQRWSGHPGPIVKFAVAPNPVLASPSITIPSPSSKSMRSTPTHSAGTSSTIPSYYFDMTLSQPPSPSQGRNRRILNPRNSSRTDLISPVSPTTPLTFWKEDDAPESPSVDAAGTDIRSSRSWHAENMPIVRDVRSSPRIVIRKAS